MKNIVPIQRRQHLFFILIFGTTLFFGNGLFAQGWNVGPGGNSLRNSLSSQIGPAGPDVLWSGGQNSVLAQQSVTDGNYLAMSRTFNIGNVLYGTKIVMHNLQTGDTLWTANLPVDFPSTDWRNRVSAINDGKVYCTRAGNNNESYLYALDAEIGSIIWKSDNVISEGSTEGLVFAPNGDPIAGSMYNITRFDVENGTTVWRTQRLSYDGGSGVLVTNDKVYGIVNLVNNVGVAAYDLETGTELYTSPQLAGGLVNQLGLFADLEGFIYLPRCQNNPLTDSLFALKDDGSALRRRWSIPIFYTPFATCGVGPDGSIYAYNRNGEIMRLDPENGAVINTSKVVLYGDANSPRMAIDASGNVFLTNGGFAQGMFYSFNPDLSLRWEETYLNINLGGPAIGNEGTLVVTGKGTDVKAYMGAGLPEVSFTKVTEGDIVNNGGWNYGMVWADFNNDNLPDIFTTNNDVNNGKNNFLYLNNGEGTFERITDGEVVNDGGSSYSATAADINQDHNVDLFVANYNENNFLYLGNGDGTFTKVTEGPLVTDGGKSVGCAWADYNVDGLLDLYVVNRDQKNFLYMGTWGNPNYFTKITEGEIVNDIANSSGCTWGDYDNDGFPDLYVANSGSPSCLYHNNGGSSFTKITDEPFVSDNSSCSGASWGDADNDGDLDLFVATGQLGMYENWYYVNNGDGSFTKITDSPLVNEATWSSGSAWGDYDKDGDLDLAVGGYDGDNLLFNNDGEGNFEKVTDNDFVNDGNYTEGLAWADYDNDGDLDIFTAKNNYFGGNNSLFLNNGNSNNWLKIHLEGDGLYNNFESIGAKVFVYAQIFGEPVMQMRELNTQSGGGQGGQNELTQFFGLGDCALVDSVVVDWFFVRFIEENVAVNQRLDLYLNISDIEEMKSDREPLLMAYPNPAAETITFRISNLNQDVVHISIFNMQSEKIHEIISFGTNDETREINWNLKDYSGKRVMPGVYFCRYVAGDESGNLKIVVGR